MRRITVTLVLLGAVMPVLIPGSASAHNAWHIVGYQYGAAGTDGVASGGYLNSPAGPTPITEGIVDDGIGSIANRDPVNHSFTECTAGCDTGAPSAEGARFDITIAPSSSATGAEIDLLNSLFEGHEDEWIIFCRFHPTWMRARLTTTGA